MLWVGVCGEIWDGDETKGVGLDGEAGDLDRDLDEPCEEDFDGLSELMVELDVVNWAVMGSNPVGREFAVDVEVDWLDVVTVVVVGGGEVAATAKDYFLTTIMLQ